MKRAAWILAGQADVMVTDASETLLQQKLNPGLCSVHPDKPFQYGEKAWLLPRRRGLPAVRGPMATSGASNG